MRAASFASALLFGACQKPPMIGEVGAISAPSSAPSAWSIPAGVYVNENERGKRQIDGLFASTQQPDPACCWMAPQSRIRFLKATDAVHLNVTVFVNPDVPSYRRKAPQVRIAIDGTVLATRDALPPGSTKIAMRLPERYRNAVGPLELRITSSRFIPARDHMNGDSRELGLVLQKVESH